MSDILHDNQVFVGSGSGKKGLSRRGFIKAAAVAAGAGVLSGVAKKAGDLIGQIGAEMPKGYNGEQLKSGDPTILVINGKNQVVLVKYGPGVSAMTQRLGSDGKPVYLPFGQDAATVRAAGEITDNRATASTYFESETPKIYVHPYPDEKFLPMVDLSPGTEVYILQVAMTREAPGGSEANANFGKGGRTPNVQDFMPGMALGTLRPTQDVKVQELTIIGYSNSPNLVPLAEQGKP